MPSTTNSSPRKKSLLHFLTGLSAVLILPTAFIMWRSFIVRDEFVAMRHTMFIVAFDSGRIEMGHASCSVGILTNSRNAMGLKEGGAAAYSQHLQFRHDTLQPGEGYLTLNHVGANEFGYYYYGNLEYGGRRNLGSAPLVNNVSAVTLPLPLLMLLLAAPPIMWLWKWRRRRLRQPGHCFHCGYDLRATPGQCPECGRSNFCSQST